VKAHDSAARHGVDPDDAVHAAEHAVFISDLDDESPARQLRLGFVATGRLLEVVVRRFDSGNELLIHAMKARHHYLDLLE
jgi:predicted hotdog family 3-hydroxylacyl-ACP dehydratase